MSERAYGENIGKPPLKVRHADLVRASEDSLYRSKCPVCKDGVLLIYRNQETGDLEARDCCIACGQLFIYLDIDDLRHQEGKAITGDGR